MYQGWKLLDDKSGYKIYRSDFFSAKNRRILKIVVPIPYPIDSVLNFEYMKDEDAKKNNKFLEFKYIGLVNSERGYPTAITCKF